MVDAHFLRPQWIASPRELEGLLADISAQPCVAVDTESNSLHAYREQVCLIQLSTNQADYLVDPMVVLDLSGLGEIFADAGIEKIFHAAEYDIICLKRSFSFRFASLFDTMLAARVLGYEKVGLSDILKEQFGIPSGKSFQKADWRVRPLTQAMRQYASIDTHYLIPLRDRLHTLLAEKGLEALAREDFHRLCAVEADSSDHALYTQVSGYHLLNGQELRVLEELCRFRDAVARRLDRPLFKVMGADSLLAIAKAKPANAGELEKMEGLSTRIVQRYREGLLTAVRDGLAKPPSLLERRKRPSQAYTDRLESLKSWRKKAAREMGVQSDIILPRDILEDIAKRTPQDFAELREIMAEVPWRLERFGGDIMKKIQHRISA